MRRRAPDTTELAAPATSLRWLADLRWATFTGQLGTVLFVAFVMKTPLALEPSVAILALLLASNLVLASRARRDRELSTPAIAAILATDVALLTALLHFGGGPMNPFTFLYVVYVALASLVLPSPWPWAVALAAAWGFGALFFLADPHAGHHHHDPASMRLHLVGMWVAFCVGAAILVAFVQRIRRALAARDAALAEARETRLRTERLAALATMAAGAAHELATPLSTIAVVAGDLARDLAAGGDARAAEDVALVRREVARCKEVLDQMAADAGASAGDATAEVALGVLVEDVAAPFGDARARLRVLYDGCTPEDSVRLPRRPIGRAIRGIVDNALQADAGTVELVVARDANTVRFGVSDRGPGMPPDVLSRAIEPFFTTKREGEGMGLGLFLAHATVEPLGGRLDLASVVGAGTTVTLVLPLAARGKKSVS